MILTLRPETMRKHPGQVSFPGGRIDPGDDGPVAAALREAEEEIGLPPAAVEVIGIADAYRTVTGFEVTPVLGIVPPDLPLSPHPGEVAAVFEAPLHYLLDPAHQHDAPRGLARAGAALIMRSNGRAADLGRDRGDDRQSEPAAGAGGMNAARRPLAEPRPAWTALLEALGADDGETRYRRRLRARHLARARGQRRRSRHPARARRGDRAARGGADQGGADRPRPRHGHRGARRRAGRGHHPAPRRRHRRPPRHRRLHRRLARGRGAARLHDQRALRRSGERRGLRLFRRPRRSRRRAGSASSATRCSASPRIICASCASSASTPASATGAPDAAGARRLRGARQRPDGAVARADRRRAAEAARLARSGADRRR